MECRPVASPIVITASGTVLTYTADSILTQKDDALGRQTLYTRDSWGRTTGISYPTTGRTGVSLTLDPEGNITQSIDETGTRTAITTTSTAKPV